MTAETAMMRIHRRVMQHIAAVACTSEAIDRQDHETLRRIYETLSDENESFADDITEIAVKWKSGTESLKNRKKRKDGAA